MLLNDFPKWPRLRNKQFFDKAKDNWLSKYLLARWFKNRYDRHKDTRADVLQDEGSGSDVGPETGKPEEEEALTPAESFQSANEDDRDVMRVTSLLND